MGNIKAMILAAGKGTRLHSEQFDMPKVMRSALGRPLLGWVLEALDFIAPEDTVIVVGYKREKVEAAFAPKGYKFALQEQQLGTGHAVQCAAAELEGFEGAVLVCCGDMPLVRGETYAALAEEHFKEGNACTLLSGTSESPLPYGRVLRDENGGFAAIIEEKDCTPEQREIRELNSGVYMFNAQSLLSALGELRADNAQKEYYLTDVPAIMRERGEKVGVFARDMNEELIGVNTVEQLEQVERLLSERK